MSSSIQSFTSTSRQHSSSLQQQQQQQQKEQKHQHECLFKVLVIGDMGTGKTSLIQRYIHDTFPTLYKPTIGIDFATKILKFEDTLVRLQFWDISGQERFANMTRVYYRDSHGAFIVYDCSSKRNTETLTGAMRWKSDLDSKLLLDNGQPIPSILVANKADLENTLTAQQLLGYVKKGRFTAGFKLSAKTGEGVDKALNSMLVNILQNERHSLYLIPILERDQQVRRLSRAEQQQQQEELNNRGGRMAQQRRSRRFTDGVCC